MPTATVRFDDLIPLLKRHTERIPATVRAAVERTLLEAVTFVTVERLSFSREGAPQPHGLRVQTGTARRSLASNLVDGSNSIIGRFGSPLRYVRAHELGYKGPVQVPAHVRRIVSLRRGPSGKVTKKSAKAYKAALVAGHKTTAQVRAHTRRVNMIARRFFRDTLREVGPKLPKRVRKSLEILAVHGRVAAPGEL